MILFVSLIFTPGRIQGRRVAKEGERQDRGSRYQVGHLIDCKLLLNELFVREVPWDGYSPMDIKQLVLKGQRPRTALTMPLACERLLSVAWHQDALQRPTFQQVLTELEGAEEALVAASHGLPPLPPDSLDALI